MLYHSKIDFSKSVDFNKKNSVDIYDFDFCCIIVGITKNEAMNLFKGADFSENSRSLQNIIFSAMYKD